MNEFVYESESQVNDWFSRLIERVEKKTGRRLGFRPPNVGWGVIKSKAILRRHVPERCYGSGGSGNYQWDFEPTLTLDVAGLTCQVIVPKTFYDQLVIGDKLRIEYWVSWSGNRIKTKMVP
jgi:hypothetical protein